jgi:hypothetical protein
MTALILNFEYQILYISAEGIVGLPNQLELAMQVQVVGFERYQAVAFATSALSIMVTHLWTGSHRQSK